MMKASTIRKGLSLMEVLISLVIFLGAMVVIGRLIIMGSERALEVKLEGQATQLCQSKLAEVVAGVVPLSGQSEVAFEEDPTWHWSLEAEQDDVPGLWRVQVRVGRQQAPQDSKIECVLNQMVLDPSLRGTSAAPPAPTGTAPSSSGSSSGSSGKSGAAVGGGKGFPKNKGPQPNPKGPQPNPKGPQPNPK